MDLGIKVINISIVVKFKISRLISRNMTGHSDLGILPAGVPLHGCHLSLPHTMTKAARLNATGIHVIELVYLW